MKVLLIFICTIAAAFGCRCRKLPSNEAFCNADWVSHVNVSNSSIVSSETEPERLLYTVTHVEVLKQPNETGSLPQTVTTSTSSASCGVSLEMGKEYLLSGSYDEGTLRTISCGQISPDDPNDSFFGIIMEWKDVSKEFRKQLSGFKC